MNFFRNASRKDAKARRMAIRLLTARNSLRLCASARVIVFLFLSIAVTAAIHAQDFGFGFGDDDAEEAPPGGAPVTVHIGGEIGAEFVGFVYDFSSEEKAKAATLGDMISGSLNFSATGANVDAFIGLNLSADSFTELASGLEPAATPLILDEAFVRAYFGPVNVEAGYRKLSWGKADSFGPLDIINPVDYTDLTNISDIQAIKIARPMVHATWNSGGFSKIEGVFIPHFTGHRFAQTGRWAPSQFSTMTELVGTEILTSVIQGITANIPPEYLLTMLPYLPDIQSTFSDLAAGFSGFSPVFPDTSGLEYFQAGLRFTTTIGSADIGAQYFYGNLFQPDVTINVNGFVDDLISGNSDLVDMISSGNLTDLASLNVNDLYAGDTSLLARIKYNRYHQIGVDYAQVLFGFNVRSEFAVFLTKDLKGSDGMVRNPFLGWSLGFDRDLFWGINANVQCNETIRLMDDKVGDNPALDCEAGTNVTSTRITMQLSKRFLKDELESKAIVIWDIENFDCYIIPAIVWNIKDVTAELSAGFLSGNTTGDLGQYWENSFIKVGLKYSF